MKIKDCLFFDGQFFFWGYDKLFGDMELLVCDIII